MDTSSTLPKDGKKRPHEKTGDTPPGTPKKPALPPTNLTSQDDGGQNKNDEALNKGMY